MKKYFTFILINCCFLFSTAQNFLTRSGNKLLDTCGQEIRLTGVNWFGFETGNKCPHGLWTRDYQGMLDQIKATGFNCIRLPWCNDVLVSGAMPSSIGIYGTDAFNGRSPMNSDLNGLTAIEVMDKVIDYCQQIGLKVILDNHSRVADNFASEEVWYTGGVSEQKWIDDWKTLVTRYKSYDAVIGADLDNEPHGQATWGNSSPQTDWNKAAERCGNEILSVHPDILIIVEGVQEANNTTYWWGGNLEGVQSHPIVLTKPEKLVYSPHEYGPEVFNQSWFSSGSFPANMPGIWDTKFGNIHKNNNGHILVGEFGIKDSTAHGGDALSWFEEFINYIKVNNLSFTYWCWNPNSGDTGGILDNDWSTVHQWKVDKLQTILTPLIGTCQPASRREETKKTVGLYPNPSTGVFYFKNVDVKELANAQVQDIYGNIIVELNNVSSIDLIKYTSGIYIVKIQMKEGVQILRLVKQ